jgi:hypothetical protein
MALTDEQPMTAEDYQLTRIALLAAISPRAQELGEEIYDDAMDEIERLHNIAVAARRLRVAEIANDEAQQAYERAIQQRDLYGRPLTDDERRDVFHSAATIAALVAAREALDAALAPPDTAARQEG